MADTAEAGSNSNRRTRGHANGDDLEAQVEQLQKDLRSITETLARMGEKQVNDTKNAAKAQAHDLLDRGHAAIADAQGEITAMEKQLKDTIRQKPLTAVASAVAVGFVIALLTR